MPFGERKTAMRGITLFIAALFATVALDACSDRPRPAVQTSASRPTVSYVYSDDDGLLDATHKAESYCARYDAWPSPLGFDKESGERHVTFACDQPRTAAQSSTTVVVPSSAPLTYPYRDDRGLVDAINEAQRYCLGLNASARSTRVITNSDGSRTVAFECDRS